MDELLKSRKIWIIAGGTLGLILIIVLFALVLTYGGDEEPTPVEETTDEGGGELVVEDQKVDRDDDGNADDSTPATTEEEAFSFVSDEAVVTANLSRDGYQIQYIADEDMTLYSMGFNGGEKTKIQTLNFTQSDKVIWSPDRVKLVMLDGSAFKIFNFDNQVVYEIPTDITDIDWIDGVRFVYKQSKQTDRRGSINIGEFNDSGSWDWTKVWDIDAPSVKLATIYNQNVISFYAAPNGSKTEDLHVVSLDGSGSRNLISNVAGLEAKWSPNGQRGIFTSTTPEDPDNITLNSVNIDGSGQLSLNMPSFITKVAWGHGSKYVYVAQPDLIPQNVILPNDYYNRKFRTADSFWRIDMDSGQVSRIIASSEMGVEVDAFNLFTSLDEKYLFFITKASGGKNDGYLGRILIDNQYSTITETILTESDPSGSPFDSPDDTPGTGTGSMIIIISLLVGSGAVFLYLGYRGVFKPGGKDEKDKERLLESIGMDKSKKKK